MQMWHPAAWWSVYVGVWRLEDFGVGFLSTLTWVLEVKFGAPSLHSTLLPEPVSPCLSVAVLSLVGLGGAALKASGLESWKTNREPVLPPVTTHTPSRWLPFRTKLKVSGPRTRQPLE